MSARRLTLACLVIGLSVGTTWAVGSELADAVMNGNKEAVRSLLQQKVDVNTPQTDGATALHWSVRADDLETTDLLIRAGANVSASNRFGVTPLVLASMNGNAAMIQKLLAAGANPNAFMPQGETPLMMAARTGNIEAVKVLLDGRADINLKETLRGTTALMWAASEEHPEVVRLLVDRGADVNARSSVPEVLTVGNGGQVANNNKPALGALTALAFAARQGDLNSARILVAAKADVNLPAADNSTPLLIAVRNGNYELASFLLDNGADPNIANTNLVTPLYEAIHNRNIEWSDTIPMWTGDKVDPLDLIAKLLEKNANPNAQIKVEPAFRNAWAGTWLKYEGATPFFRAAVSGDMKVIRLLLAYGADPGIKTKDKTTPLMAAAGLGSVHNVTRERSQQETLEVLRFLIDLGADVNAANDHGRTALHGAAHRGSTANVQFLVDRGANMMAADKGSEDTTEPLIPLDYAIGVRVSGGTAVPNPEAEALLRTLMTNAGLRTDTTSECARRGFLCNADFLKEKGLGANAEFLQEFFQQGQAPK